MGGCGILVCAYIYLQADVDVFPELWIKETEEEMEERRNNQELF